MEAKENELRSIECYEIREVITKTREKAQAELSGVRSEIEGLARISLIEEELRRISSVGSSDGPAEDRLEKLILEIQGLVGRITSDSARVKDRLPVMLERVAVIESVERYLEERLERLSTFNG
jgi:hypothetical protein